MKMRKVPRFKLKLNKGEKANESPRDPLFAMLMPSVLGIILSMLLLCGATWAWFSSTQISETASIQAANYEITVQVKEKVVTQQDETSDETSVTLTDDGAFEAAAGTEYTVTLTAGGTASTGYGEVRVGEKTLYTAQLAPGENLMFKIKLNTTATVTFGYQWGTYSGTSDITADKIVTGVTDATE